jgi:hypothetical protein
MVRNHGEVGSSGVAATVQPVTKAGELVRLTVSTQAPLAPKASTVIGLKDSPVLSMPRSSVPDVSTI